AVRRYRMMVLAIAFMTAAAAIAYTLVTPDVYRASASATVPQQLSLKDQGSTSQYLDSQVLLLESQDVAQRAVRIANAALGSNRLVADDFSGGALKIIPPQKSSTGSSGTSTITVSFTWPDPRVAQIGANAMLQAFDEARSAAIIAQGNAILAAITKAIAETPSEEQMVDLLKQRRQALVNQKIDLVHHPTFAWAAEPQVPINNNSKRAGAIGLLIGTVLGAALAYARASRRNGFDNPPDPAALYGVPLIGEIPAFEKKKMRFSETASAGRLLMSTNPHSAVAEAFRFTAGCLERIRAAGAGPLSLVFVSTGAINSTIVANLALAIAEGGTRVLAVDAADGELTALLLPGSPTADGFEQVLAGQQATADCVQPSPWNEVVTVLGSGVTTPERVTGAAYSQAVDKLLTEAKASFDVILIDSPALLQVADAAELVGASDAVIIVVNHQELIRDHLDMMQRLDLIKSDVVGYIYKRAPKLFHAARYRREAFAGQSARLTGSSAVPPSPAHRRARALAATQPPSRLPKTGR
ncbi:MAG: AAA family ATPase, partial [Actinomycetota bacterium]|nr:AAA family ATPase [Actinomycetota bacterium]